MVNSVSKTVDLSLCERLIYDALFSHLLIRKSKRSKARRILVLINFFKPIILYYPYITYIPALMRMMK